MGLLLPDELGHEVHELHDGYRLGQPLGLPLRLHGLGGEDPHEPVHLLALLLPLSQKDGKGEVGGDVHEHAPEEGVGIGIEPGQPEQGIGGEELKAQGAVGKEVELPSPRLQQRREQKRVEPDRETEQKPGNGPGLVSPGPVEPPYQRRGELDRRGKGDEPHVGEHVALSHGALVQVAQKDDEDYAEPLQVDEEQGEPGPRLEPHHHRHQHVVQEHGGDRDRFHHHHAGGGGEPAQEGDQGKPRIAKLHGEGEHEVVGAGGAAGQKDAGQGDRHDEQVHQEHVGGEAPGGGVQVRFVGVLQHHDLELPRQKHHGAHGEGKEAEHRGVGVLARLPQRGESGEERRVLLLHAREDVPHAVEGEVGDGDPHGEHRHQLHQRLEGDGGNEAVVTLRGGQVPRAEDDAEDGKQSRGEQARVGGGDVDALHEPQVEVVVSGDDGEGGGDRLQLQGYVRHDPHQGDHRDDGAEPLRAPVAGTDEVGDGGDVVVFGDPDDLLQQEPPGESGQGRAEVDRKEVDAGGGRLPDAAVEGPGGGIDGDGERVHRRVGRDAPAGPLPHIGVVGDQEQECDVQERGAPDPVDIKHQGSPWRRSLCARPG